MEYVDLYDERRVPLGRTHPRKERVAPGEYFVVVGVWAFRRGPEILLTKRHPDKRYAPNLWENTGGHVMAGERSAAAVVRELFEETGIRADEGDLHMIGTVKVPPFFGDNYVLYRDLPASEVVLRPGETCDAKWVTLEEFNRMAERGELAPSVVEHLKPIRAAWEAALMRAGQGGE